jgi:hypothetical protein
LLLVGLLGCLDLKEAEDCDCFAPDGGGLVPCACSSETWQAE